VYDAIELEVFGTPEPQGNKTAFLNKRTGKIVMTEGRRPDARERFTSWRDAVAWEARAWQTEHNAALLDEPCMVTITFRMPRPKSAPKRMWPGTRPDVDKLTRAVLDALTGTIIANDSRVCELHVYKRFAVDTAPGCSIKIEVL
jgi:crossover junction endodeoxyribonuclease RusA